MSLEKKKVRNKLRWACLERDNRTCRVCDRRVGAVDEEGNRITLAMLDAHHITPRTNLPNQGNVIDNVITLCPPCHEYAEAFLNGDREHEPPTKRGWHAYAPSALYALIGSSYEKAKAASEAAS